MKKLILTLCIATMSASVAFCQDKPNHSADKVNEFLKSAHDAEYTISYNVFQGIQKIKQLDSTINEYQYQINKVLANGDQIKSQAIREINAQIAKLQPELDKAKAQFDASGITNGTLATIDKIKTDMSSIVSAIKKVDFNSIK